MDGDSFVGKDWAALFSVVADGQDVVKLLAREFIHALRAVAGNVDSQLARDGDGLGPNVGRLGPRAKHFGQANARFVTKVLAGQIA